MLRPNGEDFTKPLVQRSRPSEFGRFGAFRFPVGEPTAQPLGQGRTLLAAEARHLPEASWPSEIEFELPASQHVGEREAEPRLSRIAASRLGELTFRNVRPRSGSAFVPYRIPGPLQFFAKVLQFWGLSANDATSLLGYEPADQRLVEELLAGRASLRGRDAKDRIATLFRIRSLLAELFQSPDVENAWLREPRSDLGNRCPLDLLRDGSMENLLLLRQYVEHVSGL
jgi:hypothetical protein